MQTKGAEFRERGKKVIFFKLDSLFHFFFSTSTFQLPPTSPSLTFLLSRCASPSFSSVQVLGILKSFS